MNLWHCSCDHCKVWRKAMRCSWQALKLQAQGLEQREFIHRLRHDADVLELLESCEAAAAAVLGEELSRDVHAAVDNLADQNDDEPIH